MNWLFYISFPILLAAIVVFIVLNSRKWKFDLTKVVKVLSVVLVVMFFVNIFLPDLFATRGLPGSRTGIVDGKAEYNLAPHAAWLQVFDSTLGRGGEILHTIARVGLAIAPVSIPFAIFYNKKQIARVVSFIVLPFAILNAVLFFQYLKMATFNDPLYVLNGQLNQFGSAAREFLQNNVLRTLWFEIGMLITTGLAFYVAFTNWKQIIKFDGWKDILTFVGIALALVFTNMPIYTAQHLFHSYTNIILTIGYSGHFLFIGFIIAEAVVAYFLLRNQTWENKYITMFIMAISLLIQYNTFFKTDGIIIASRWPLQLCNIAGAFIIVTLLTRSDKMFHFTLVVNALGAFIAIAICDSTFNTGILYEMNIHYMVEHINVILVPVLCGLLKVFKPLKKEDVIHVVVGFATYWAAIMVIGTILCTLQDSPMNLNPGEGKGFFDGVNYLFMFNAARSIEMVGFVKPLFEVEFNIGKAKFTLAQFVILLVFEALCVGVFFLFYSFLKEKKQVKAAK